MDGYAVKVKCIRVIDGDTVVVAAVGDADDVVRAYRTTLFECPEGGPVRLRAITHGMEANVRLADFSAPEMREPGGEECKGTLIRVLEENRWDLWLFVERPVDTNGNGLTDLPEVLRQRVSFNRVVGRIMVGNFDDGCRSVADWLSQRKNGDNLT